MCISKIILTNVLFLGVSLFFLPKVTHAESVQEAISMAITNHPSVIAQQNKLDATYMSIKEEKSAYFPQLSVNTSIGRMYGDNSTSRGLNVTRGAGTSGLWDGSIALRQRVYDFGEVKGRVASVENKTNSDRVLLDDVYETVTLKTIQAYLNVMRTNDLYRKNKENLAILKGHHNKISVMVEEGVLSEAELQQASDIVYLSESSIYNIEAQQQNASFDYNELTGSFPKGNFYISLPDDDIVPDNIDDAIRIALLTHPQVKSLRYKTISSEHDIDVERTTLMPKLNSEFSYSRKDQRDVIGGESTDARAILKASWDFSFGGAQTQRIKKGKKIKQENLAREQEIIRLIEKNLRYSYTEMNLAKRSKVISGNRTRLADELLKTYNVQFEASKVSLLDIMSASSSLNTTQTEEINAGYRYISSIYSTKSAIGNLKDAMIKTAKAE